MIQTNRKRLLSLILCALLAWTVAFGITGCSDDNTTETPKVTESVAASDEAESDTEAETQSTAPETTADADVTELGEGETSFGFTVVDGEGNETVYSIKTDKTTVGEALLELGLIEGEESEYGLYVKKVNGITADYDADGTYWAFYVNGEYAMSGVDSTEIESGAEYAFKVEK